MDYKLSENLFYDKFCDKNKHFTHYQKKTFLLFPFVANNTDTPVRSMEHVTGDVLCRNYGKFPKDTDKSSIISALKKQIKIEKDDEEVFEEIVSQLFFSADGNIVPLNIPLLMNIKCNTPREADAAQFITDVLCDKSLISDVIQKCFNEIEDNGSVIEKLMLSSFDFNEKSKEQELNYYRVTTSLYDVFLEDFKFVLSNQMRAREYINTLLQIYFFSYTAQSIMQINRFLYGERDKNQPLYFSLEWEKTSQSRKCYTEGWNKLQNSIKPMFAHTIVLELLNLLDEHMGEIDYITLREMTENDNEIDFRVSKEIEKITQLYRECITDCPEMTDLEYIEGPDGARTISSVRYLYDCVNTQFIMKRSRPYSSCAKQFETFCTSFLKNRGRSGYMLNLTEEVVILLTKLAIKNNEQMRLIDVFAEFERRGFYLDSLSKDCVADFYEKLNLIEKKSDSGDAKYVKRIL